MFPTNAAYTRLEGWRLARLEGRLTNDRSFEWAWAPHAGIRVQSEARRRGAVRAANETVARRVLPSVLSSPGTVDIKVANENNAALGVDALVTDVDFAIEGGVTLFEVDGTIIKQG